jgi:hypothetical protein
VVPGHGEANTTLTGIKELRMSLPYRPTVYDVRPSGHGSFNQLPKLGSDEFDRLVEFYKFELDFTHGYERAKPGELYWKVAGIELKAGPAILQPQVRDQSGRLLTSQSILLFLHWPGADKWPNDIQVDPPYYGNGVGGFTETKGSVGWGFGGESHIGPDGGPFGVWCSSDPTTKVGDRRVGSDLMRKIGWWDDHIVPNPIFQVAVKDTGDTPPPSTGSLVLVNLDAQGNVVGYMPWIPAAPVAAEKGSLGLMQDGVVTYHIPWK